MTVEEVRKYAKEQGVSENLIDRLVAELHPDENGKLSIEESIQACYSINCHTETKEFAKWSVEQVKAMRSKRNKSDK